MPTKPLQSRPENHSPCGCIHKAKYLNKYAAEKDEGKNKIMKINVQWEK